MSEPSLTELEEKYLGQAFRSTFISGGAGKFKERLEKDFSALCGCSHGIATANGTVAIDLALTAAGLNPGDEVRSTSRACKGAEISHEKIMPCR